MARNAEFKFQLRLDAPKSWHELTGEQQAAVSEAARKVAEENGFSTKGMWEPDLEERHTTRNVIEMVWNLRKN